MKQVSEQEIALLHQFVQKRFVEFYDVELELVDHLANGIEQQWADNPELRFEEAKQIEFKKFGIFGFAGVVEQKQENLSSLYIKEMMQYAKSFFSFPKIVLTIAIYLSLFAIGYKGGEIGINILRGVAGSLLFIFLGLGVYWNYDIRKNRKRSRMFLLDSIAIKVFFGGAFMPFIMQVPFLVSRRTDEYSIFGLIFICLVILLLGLWTCIMFFIFKPYFTQQIERIEKQYA